MTTKVYNITMRATSLQINMNIMRHACLPVNCSVRSDCASCGGDRRRNGKQHDICWKTNTRSTSEPKWSCSWGSNRKWTTETRLQSLSIKRGDGGIGIKLKALALAGRLLLLLLLQEIWLGSATLGSFSNAGFCTGFWPNNRSSVTSWNWKTAQTRERPN